MNVLIQFRKIAIDGSSHIEKEAEHLLDKQFEKMIQEYKTQGGTHRKRGGASVSFPNFETEIEVYFNNLADAMALYFKYVHSLSNPENNDE